MLPCSAKHGSKICLIYDIYDKICLISSHKSDLLLSDALINVVSSSQVVQQGGTTFIAGIVLRWHRWSASRVPMSPSCLQITKVKRLTCDEMLTAPS